LDFGTKRNILNCFVERGAYLKVYPAKTEVEEILKFGAHGFFLSNGPGAPASMDYAVKTIKSLLQLDKPTIFLHIRCITDTEVSTIQ
jgi:carbamoyl-phosphate synthase small subunit